MDGLFIVSGGVWIRGLEAVTVTRPARKVLEHGRAIAVVRSLVVGSFLAATLTLRHGRIGFLTALFITVAIVLDDSTIRGDDLEARRVFTQHQRIRSSTSWRYTSSKRARPGRSAIRHRQDSMTIAWTLSHWLSLPPHLHREKSLPLSNLI